MKKCHQSSFGFHFVHRFFSVKKFSWLPVIFNRKLFLTHLIILFFVCKFIFIQINQWIFIPNNIDFTSNFRLTWITDLSSNDCDSKGQNSIDPFIKLILDKLEIEEIVDCPPNQKLIKQSIEFKRNYKIKLSIWLSSPRERAVLVILSRKEKKLTR